jgi:hypothetical protein
MPTPQHPPPGATAAAPPARDPVLGRRAEAEPGWTVGPAHDTSHRARLAAWARYSLPSARTAPDDPLGRAGAEGAAFHARATPDGRWP